MKILVPIFLLISPISLLAQWTGPGVGNTTGDIYRTGNVSIGTSAGSIPLAVFQSTGLGLPINSFSIIHQLGGYTGPNVGANKFYNNVWLRKIADNDNSWYGTVLHDGISIDGTYNSPGTNSRTWWERNPSATIQSWGDIGNTYMTLKSGNLGIGTTTPSTILNVDPKGAGSILIGNSNTSSGSYTSLSVGISAQTSGYALLQCTGKAGTSFGNIVLNGSGGNVLIAKTSQANPNYKLDINGDVRANRVVVNTTGADFVFDSSYKLMSLGEVENYIQQNHHLPEIAPAAEMRENGADLGENQTKLLQKVEELTLYLIEQNKVIKELKEQVELLKNSNRLSE